MTQYSFSVHSLYIALLSLGGLVFFTPTFVLAAPDPTSLGGGLKTVESQIVDKDDILKNLKGITAIQLLGRAIFWLLSIVALLALVVLIYGGIMYIVSLGDEKKTEHAKHIIFYAILGLLVVGLSFLIIEVVKTALTTVPNVN